jgi:transposase
MARRIVSPPAPVARVGDLSIGIDIAKDSHWVTAITEHGDIVFDRRVENTPPALDGLVTTLRTLGETRAIGLDMLGGMATLLTALLVAAGETVVHVPGKAVNRARTGFRSGENKSDPRDARTIAEYVRTRRDDCRVLTLDDDRVAGLKVLVAQRRARTVEQVRRLAQLHELLQQVHPGLDRRLDLRQRLGGLYLLTRFVTPQEIREAGVDGVLAFLTTFPHRLPTRRTIAQDAVDAATEQQRALPAEAITAELVRALAADALAGRQALTALDDRIAKELTFHPEAALVQSLPGMGVVCTAEFLAHAGSMHRYKSADHLAAYAGLAPVIRQTGRTRFLSRPLGGNKHLKRACFQAARAAMKYHFQSRHYYQHKRDEGKTHLQAVIALARRRMIVLYAMLRDHTAYTAPPPPAEQHIPAAAAATAA